MGSIRGALEHVSSHLPGSALIATDSKSALQALKNSSPTDNRQLLTHIHSILHTLQEEGIHLSFIWIPSHIGIKGNEKADTIAKEAARWPAFDDEIPKSLSIIKQQTSKNIMSARKQDHKQEVDKGSITALWYAQATSLKKIDLSPDLPLDTQKHIHRLHLGYPSPCEIIKDIEPPQCIHCNKITTRPLLHYILECPKTGTLRRNINNIPSLTYPAWRETAARLLANMSIITRIAELVKITPPPK